MTALDPVATLIPLDLIPLDLIPLDIPADPDSASQFSFLPLLLIILVALIAMVGVLLWIRRRRGRS